MTRGFGKGMRAAIDDSNYRALLPVKAENQCLRLSLGRNIYTTVKKCRQLKLYLEVKCKNQLVDLNTHNLSFSAFLVDFLGNGRNH